MPIFKKTIKNIAFVIMCLIISFCVSLTVIPLSMYFADSIKLKNFHKYMDDYQTVANRVIELQDEGVISEEDNYFFVEDGKADEVVLTKSEKRSLLNIDKTFVNNDYPLSMIRVHGNNFVVFLEAEYFSFGVVYSKDGSKPENFGGENSEDTKYKVKYLAYQWYVVEKK